MARQFNGLEYHCAKWYSSGQMTYRLGRHWLLYCLSYLLNKWRWGLQIGRLTVATAWITSPWMMKWTRSGHVTHLN